jgi:hypothetical protein
LLLCAGFWGFCPKDDNRKPDDYFLLNRRHHSPDTILFTNMVNRVNDTVVDFPQAD